MKEMKFLPAILGGRVFIMNKILLLIVLCLAIPAFSHAQGPLAASYTPSIDTTCSDSQYAANVWMTDTMQKILQSNTTAATNSCYITIYATQGEFADLQVHVVAPSGGYSALTVSSSSFVQSSPSSYTIPAPSTSSNKIVVYREAYITTTTKSNSGPAYYNTTGAFPDALIPTIDPYYHQTTNAFPVAVAANQTQSAWVDIFVPLAAPSGYYLGSITVSNSSTTLATLPVILAVWQWPSAQGGYMPTTPTLPSFMQFGWHNFCAVVVGTCSDANADSDGGVIFMDHRWTMTDPINTINSSQYAMLLGGGTTGVTTATSIIPGATTTGVNWRSLTGLWSEQQFVTDFGSITYPSGSTGGSTPYPKTTPFYQTADEPGNSSSAWASLCSAGTAAHAVTPSLATEATTTIAFANTYSGTNCLDIITVNVGTLEGNGSNNPTGLLRSTYNSWLSHSNPDGIKPMLWSYISCYSTPCGSGYGAPYNYVNYAIDGRPASNRGMEWMTYFHQQTGELYYYTQCAWTGNSYNNGCGVALNNDPWTNQYFSGNNGDGTLAYPSSSGTTQHVTLQSGSQLTTQIWIPSIRMKHMRDGMQDWEYMNALTVAGQGSFVMNQIASSSAPTPGVGWITNSYTYDYTGTGLQAARLALGTALHQSTYPATLLPPPSLSGTVQ